MVFTLHQRVVICLKTEISADTSLFDDALFCIKVSVIMSFCIAVCSSHYRVISYDTNRRYVKIYILCISTIIKNSANTLTDFVNCYCFMQIYTFFSKPQVR